MNRKNKASILGFAAGMLLLVLLATNGVPFLAGAQAKPMVAVTIAPQAAFVREVAGNLVNVVTMMPPGANHETYSPPPRIWRNSAQQRYIWRWDCRRNGPACCPSWRK